MNWLTDHVTVSWRYSKTEWSMCYCIFFLPCPAHKQGTKQVTFFWGGGGGQVTHFVNIKYYSALQVISALCVWNEERRHTNYSRCAAVCSAVLACMWSAAKTWTSSWQRPHCKTPPVSTATWCLRMLRHSLLMSDDAIVFVSSLALSHSTI